MDSPPPTRILSLCSGIAGLDLGVHAAIRSLGGAPRTVAYVEGEAYAAAVLAARMEEGALDPAPIWSDLRTFDAAAWRGAVDIVLGGYPCQPFSSAGKRRGKEDPRHLWPHVLRVLVESGASILFAENVRGHASLGLREVIGQLACFGFDAEWDVFSAEEEGAPHRRERLFVFAYRNGFNLRHEPKRLPGRRTGEFCPTRQAQPGNDGPQGPLANPDGEGQPQGPERPIGRRLGHRRLSVPAPNAKGPGVPGLRESCRDGARVSRPSSGSWWGAEPDVGRVVDGLHFRVDRVRALGNAVVPACAERAFLELSERASGR